MKRIALALAALAILFACDKEKSQTDDTPGGGGGQQEEEVVVTTLDAYDITYESVRLVGKADFPDGFWEKHNRRDIQIRFIYSSEDIHVESGEIAGIDEMSDDGCLRRSRGRFRQ